MSRTLAGIPGHPFLERIGCEQRVRAAALAKPHKTGVAFQAFPPRAPRLSASVRAAFTILSSAALWFLLGCVAWVLMSGLREVLHAVAS